MWQCLSVVDNVMFLMLNEDKDFEIRTSQTTNQTKRHKRRHLKQKKLPVAANTTTSTCLESRPLLFDCMCASASTSRCVFIGLAHVVVCVGLFECKRMCAGEHPAQSHHYDPHPQTS